MGLFVNPGNDAFKRAARSKKYIDKTEMINFTNEQILDLRPFICVSRPRRFGKSIAANMLVAYYSKGCDSKEIFSKLKIAQSPDFEDELNKNTVIYMDVQWFRSIAKEKGQLNTVVSFIQTKINEELKQVYPDIIQNTDTSLPENLSKIYNAYGEQFIVIIDEWDCLFREDKEKTDIQEQYINFLRGMFKSGHSDSFIKLAYITGILPVKKYGTQSAMNNFKEYTMINPLKLAEYVGFTESEVKELCKQFDMDFEECKRWYNGYSFNKMKSVYCPDSVITAMENEEFGNYWTKTETYESLKFYIDINLDGVRDAIILMLSGEQVKVDPDTFQNDLINIETKNDVLTLLVHLGYLAYNSDTKSVFIPNEEVHMEFVRATRNSGRPELAKLIKNSDELLEATLRMDCEKVAKGIESAHQFYTSPGFYNNEQSLRMIIMLAYISRTDYYCDFQELPGGKGYADILFLPRRNSDKPALLIELKWNKSGVGAIEQIKEKGYCEAISNYGGDILLVGINYDEKNKKHSCCIEKFVLIEEYEKQQTTIKLLSELAKAEESVKNGGLLSQCDVEKKLGL